MIKRGRPKGATAYPETAVCIKCRVFRPKRRGFCDRCRPRNRSSKSNMDVTSTVSPPPAAATSSSACSTAVLRANTAIAPAVRGPQTAQPAARQGLEPESRGVKRIKEEEEERATTATATTAGNADTTAQIRAKRRRTVSAPAPVAAAQPLSTLLTTPADRNRNVDVIQAAGKDPKFDVASPLFYPFAMSSTSAAAHHLAILLPRSDGTAVDIVPLQFLSTAPATATTVSPSPSAFSPASSSSSSSYTSSPASSPAAALASTQALMSLASVSALAASHQHATASPSSHSSASSPASSPPRRFFPASPQSSPSTSSFAAAPFAPFAQPQQLQSLLQLHAATAAAASSLPKAASSKAGDLMLPSLGSLALPRPALPPRNNFNLPGYATVPGVQLASFVSGTSGGLRHQ